MAETDNRKYSACIRSPALYLGEIEVVESQGSRGARFSGTWLKNLFIPGFLWLVRYTPTFVALLPVRGLGMLAWMAYPFSRNPLRRSCEAVSAIAAARGHRHKPRRLYQQFIGNFVAALRNYIDLYRDGAEALSGRIHIADQDAERIEALRRHHQGVILAVPHNLASALSGLKLNRTWPTLLVARNSPTIARTKAALAFFERMEVKILMVRGGNPVALSRSIISALKQHYVVAATLDNLSTQKSHNEVTLFGQTVGFAPWAAKIAAKHRVPVVPVYFASVGNCVEARFGEPMIADETEKLVAHYAAFFEHSILRDPPSWAYLGDKRWRRVLEQARAGEDRA